MEKYFEKLRTYIAENPPDFGDGDSVLTLLYEAYADSNKMDDGTIKEDFNELYHQMTGMELREMDKIIYPVCTLCRDHQRSGFMEGIKVGIRLREELTEEEHIKAKRGFAPIGCETFCRIYFMGLRPLPKGDCEEIST